MIVPVEGRIEGAREAVRSPFTFDHQRPTSSGAAPLVGQHDDEIRHSLGLRPGQWPQRERMPIAEPA